MKEIIGNMSVMEANICTGVVRGNDTQSRVVNVELKNVISCYLLTHVYIGTSTTKLHRLSLGHER